jgi:hypothetical protein
MKVERIVCGMQTADGKIKMLMTPGVRQLLTQKSIDTIRSLKVEDSHHYFWFPTEQAIAYSIVIQVQDKQPLEKGRRTWTQNQTFIVGIHDFIQHHLNGESNPFQHSCNR